MTARHLRIGLCLSLLLLAVEGGVLAQGEPPAAPAAADVLAGSGFTYQGELQNGGGPVTGTCDFEFSLYDAVDAGAQVGGTQTVSNVTVANGRFTASLNENNEFGTRAFDGSARWLAVAVRCPAGSGSYTALSPRQALTAAPLALALPGVRTEINGLSPNVVGGHLSNTVTAGQAGATIGGGGTSTEPNQVVTGFGTIGGGYGNSIGTGSNAATVSGGRTNTVNGQYGTVSGGYSNTVSSSYATAGGGFGQSVSGSYATVGGGYRNSTGNFTAPTIGGGYSNTVGGAYATVSGGYSNTVNALHAAVGGGTRNFVGGASSSAATIGGGQFNTVTNSGSATISGGYSNTVSAQYATVGGGRQNSAGGQGATAGGGYLNTATGLYATVGGGYQNTTGNYSSPTIAGGSTNSASNNLATVGGGGSNAASGVGATVPGGYGNTAQGDYSLAAGEAASALHNGAFVWACNFCAATASSADSQFVANAAGGFWLGHGSTGGPNGPIASTHLISTSTGAYLSTAGVWTNVSDRNAKTAFAPVSRAELLLALQSLPIQSWTYKVEDASIRHIGPTAQDFHAAFGVGADDTHLAALDTSGVALAAIQGLHEVVLAQAAEQTAQRAEIAQLQVEQAALEARLRALEAGGRPLAPTAAWPWLLLAGLGLLNAGAVLGYRAARGRRA